LDLEKEFSLTSENKRVFIIDGIEKATTSGANTLLKFLEEANENTYGILLTDNVSLVLPTIVSRSQVVNFAPINRNIMLIELIDNNISQELSAAISSIASSLDEAFNLSKDEKFHEIFKLAKKISESIIVDEYDPVLDYSIDIKFLNGADINLYHNYLIDLLILLENDKLHFKTKNYDGVMFSDFVSLFDNDIDIQKQFNIIQIFMELKEELKYNINVVTAMLAALIKVKRC
jgi:DNA polymerase-3 subunit delta'